MKSIKSMANKDGDDVVIDRPSRVKETKTANKIKKPKMQSIWFYNDETTPLPFVVELITEVFGMSHQKAFNIVVSVHNREEEKFLVFKAGEPVVKEKAERLRVIIEKESQDLTFSVEDEPDDED
jgi:ATP-dependent Clp protease adaptor protein ClpS